MLQVAFELFAMHWCANHPGFLLLAYELHVRSAWKAVNLT